MLRNQLPKNSKYLTLLVRAFKKKKKLFSDTLYPYKFGMTILGSILCSPIKRYKLQTSI